MDPQPVMLSEASVFRTELGGTLTLPCAVKDLGPFILIWKKGNRSGDGHKIDHFLHIFEVDECCIYVI